MNIINQLEAKENQHLCTGLSGCLHCQAIQVLTYGFHLLKSTLEVDWGGKYGPNAARLLLLIQNFLETFNEKTTASSQVSEN